MSLTLAQFAMMGGDYPTSKSGNGYLKLPNGMILQWGLNNPSGNSSGAVITFPTAFPTSCLAVVTSSCAGPAAIGRPSASSFSTSGFTLSSCYIVNGTTTWVTDLSAWVAIGY
jgi:hypothetical protein